MIFYYKISGMGKGSDNDSIYSIVYGTQIFVTYIYD